ncbi:MAG: HigA family addiction module antitoxin [Bryocella sp.]
MHNPSHPGALIRESMGRRVTVTALAKHLGVTRPHLSTILNGKSNLSPLMSLKLDETFNNSEGFWWGIQQQYDLAQARRIRRKKLRPIFTEKLKQAA